MTKTVQINVDGMTCNHCVMTVKKAILGVDGVLKADVDLDAKSANIKFRKNKTETSEIVEAINQSGYKASF